MTTTTGTVPETLTRRQVRDHYGLGPTEVEVAFRALPVVSLTTGHAVFERVWRRDIEAWLLTRRGAPRTKREKRHAWRTSGVGIGCVDLYVFTDGAVIKIGVTQRHVALRRAEAQAASGRYLELVTAIRRVDVDLERMLHAEFSACRRPGEWFDIPDQFARRFRAVLRRWLTVEEKPW